MKFKLGQKFIDKIRGYKGSEYKPIKSFSQTGEDIIVNQALSCLKVGEIKYLDIGAHHSTKLSNTRFFYDKNFSGVLIEPDPTLFKEIKKNRNRDICLNCGIGVKNEISADFYIMKAPTLNTFSKEEAERNEKENNIPIEKVIKIELKNINDIMQKYFIDGCDFMSLDVEGLDLDILNSLDFNKYRPKVICVETLNFDNEIKKQLKNKNIIQFLTSKNYFIHADTFINTIFIDSTIW